MEILSRRPIVVALAGPNGAGKSSFYGAFLRLSGLRFVNADLISKELDIDAYSAAQLAGELRWKLIEEGESFIFETVFSDPVGDKLGRLKAAELRGFTVVLFFIGIDSPGASEERVAIRVSKGGHDVPPGKVAERYPRVMANLGRALRELSNLLVFDNSDLKMPYRLVATREGGREINLQGAVPEWLRSLLP